MIRISSLPYPLVVLASLMPWLAANLNSRVAALAPDLAMIGVFVMLALQGRLRLATSPVSIAMTLAIGAHAAIGILDGRGIGSGGLVLLALEIFVFYKLLEAAPDAVTPAAGARWVTRLYKLHLLFLGFELVACLAGYRDFFVGISGASTVTTIYKTYNTAALLNYFGYSGLNSLLLGSQSASQLALFALAWFVGARLLTPAGQKGRANLVWVVFAAAMYLLNATMTGNALLVMLLVMALLLFRRARRLGRKAAWVMVPFGLLFAGELAQVFLFRLLNDGDILIYQAALEVPLAIYREIGLYRQLLGWGSHIDEFVIEDTNFGLGALVFQVGLLLTIACLACVAAFWKRLVTARAALERGTPEARAAAYMAIANGMLATGWFASLIHYTPAIELGGRQILAFHAALALFYAQASVAPFRAAAATRHAPVQPSA